MPETLIDDLPATAERVRRATVQVEGGGRRGGSGVIWRTDGLVVTNAHVARGTGARIRLSDGRLVRATVAARDPQLDIALLQADSGDLPEIIIGDSDALRAGQLVLAVGSPYGQAGTVTVGVIHANGGGRWVQANVRLAPGNSGGPLADAEGRVVAINTMVMRGLALAIPSNLVARFVERRGRPAQRLGVTVQPVNTPGFGLLIVEIEAASLAQRSGLQVGDVLTGSQGRPFQAPFDLAFLLEALAEPSLHLDVLRGGRQVSVELMFELPAVGADVG
jgi:serine protease Do